MINKKLDEIPDAKPMIFLLSDGEQNRGNSLDKISGIVENLQIPIYTIGYNNANLTELGKLSAINEAASINADSDDVVYQLKNLFNSNL
jgi:Ca-activated chloride channel family protein